jgi:quercetin dioxygenase-like cupin family protein
MLLVVTNLGTAASFAVAHATPNDQSSAIAQEQTVPNVFEPLGTFEAVGLPAGSAKGVAVIANFPPGFSLKHSHGGPSYVYVIEGTTDIIEADGTTTTYNAGDFFWEPGGHTHTAQTSTGSRAFVLRFLTPGAEATIPAK